VTSGDSNAHRKGVDTGRNRLATDETVLEIDTSIVVGIGGSTRCVRVRGFHVEGRFGQGYRNAISV
jgi:hypothetical protein